MASNSTLGVLPISSVLTVCPPPTTTLSTYRAASTARIASANRGHRVVLTELLSNASPSFLPQIAVDSRKTGSAGQVRSHVLRALSATRKKSPLLTSDGNTTDNNVEILNILPPTSKITDSHDSSDLDKSSTSSHWQRRSNFPTFSSAQMGGKDFSRTFSSPSKSSTFEKLRKESVESALAKAAVRLETKGLLQEEETSLRLNEEQQQARQKDDDRIKFTENVTHTFQELKGYLETQSTEVVSTKKRKHAKKNKKKTEKSKSKKKSLGNKNPYTKSFKLSLEDPSKTSDDMVLYSSRYSKVKLSNVGQDNDKTEDRGLQLQHQASVGISYNQHSFREATMIYGSRINAIKRAEYHRNTVSIPPSNNYQELNSIISKTLDSSFKIEGSQKPQIKTIKIYQSEKQSPMIKDQDDYFLAAPPASPTPVHLKQYFYVPSMNDIRSQRAFRAKLQNIEQKARKESEKKKVELKRAEQLQMKDEIAEIKQKQRLQIYALNKIMSQLENDNYRKFCEAKNQIEC